ncbi:nitroreductase family protein [Arthrobacter sp. TMT4-20]
MINKLRRPLGRVRKATLEWLKRGNSAQRGVYYSLFSDAFRRERELVSSGHREHAATIRGGKQFFLLRRNIHMLEKGLTMQPRRPLFGLDYISETVRLFGKLMSTELSVLSTSEEGWASEVLEQYFDATRESGNSVVLAAEGAFRALQLPSNVEERNGPHAPFSETSTVSIEDLTKLAVRRKSVRWYLPRPVPRESIDAALMVARQSPSACNRQPFSFRVFDEPDLVQEVVKIPMGTAGYGHNLPALAVIVGDLSAFSDERDRHLIYTDGCLAAMAFILGLESQGISSVCINWPDIAERDKRMSDFLGLKPFERVVMLVGFGFSDSEGLTPHSEKRSLESLRRYN